MAWLCVNKDGQELICKHEPSRHGNIITETHSPFGRLDKASGKRYISKPAKSWEIKKLSLDELSYWQDEEIWGGGEFCPDFSIELHKGSIEKLINRKLTWNDEPIEFN